MVANVTSQITVEVYITVSSVDYHLIKDAPIPAGSALQILDGGAKVVLQSGDALKIKSNTASSADVWVSVVDASAHRRLCLILVVKLVLIFHQDLLHRSLTEMALQPSHLKPDSCSRRHRSKR